MTSKDFLRLHLTLLLSQHGEQSVLESLAPLLGSSADELRLRLADVQSVSRARSRSVSGSEKPEPIEALLAAHPEKAQVVLELRSRFEARTFLPEMKDVRRFLDRHGQPRSSLKKRDAGFAQVAQQLVKLPLADLQAMLAMPADTGFSSLGVIADQILGRN